MIDKIRVPPPAARKNVRVDCMCRKKKVRCAMRGDVTGMAHAALFVFLWPNGKLWGDRKSVV